MMFVRCQKCLAAFSVIGDTQELSILEDDQWKVNFPCVAPLCSGRANRIDIREAEGAQPIPAAAFYRAIQGNGWSKRGGPAEPARVLELLRNKRVVAATAFPVGDPVRTILRSLTLEDGTVLHFESSNQGACVFYVEELTRERDSVDAGTNSEGRIADRGKARLPSQEVGGPECVDDSTELQRDPVPPLP